MKTTTDEFERAMRDALNAFHEPKPLKPKHKPTAVPPPESLLVELIVRKHKLSEDVIFAHTSRKISKLEARLDAEKEARAAGWPIIGRLHDITLL